jgi:hypothetical protein
MLSENKTPDRNLHGNEAEEANALENEAQIQANLGNIEKAVELYEKDLKLRKATEQKEKRPIHKGAPLYSIGILMMFQTEDEYKKNTETGVKERQPSALDHILWAYIEDLISSDLGHEIDAEVNYAGLALKQFFDLDTILLEELRSRVSVLKKEGKWNEVFDPREILDEVTKSKGKTVDFSRVLKEGKFHYFIPRQPIGFPDPWEKRVFVGGNYLEQKPIISLIERIVLKLGFVPVVMSRTMIPQGKTHHHSIMMLHTCKYAIIDVTDEAGQLMELERTFDFEIQPLVLIKKSYWNIGKISEMVKTWREVQSKPYDDSSFEAIEKDLEALMREYLK